MTPQEIADQLDCGGLFATRDTIEDAVTYADTIANTLRGADKVAMLTAVAVLCNTIAAKLRS